MSITTICNLICSIGIIMNNNPTIEKHRAEKIALHLDKYKKQFKIPARIMLGIWMHESAYKVNAVNHKSKDYGIGQINERTIKLYGIDKDRLLKDLDYSIYKSVKVFSWFYKNYPPKEAIKRYNVGTRPTAIQREEAKKYYKKVEKYALNQ